MGIFLPGRGIWKKILFDTGANGYILLDNMKKLHIDPMMIGDVFISHAHMDHLGGLSYFQGINQARIFIPATCPEPRFGGEVIKVREPLQI